MRQTHKPSTRQRVVRAIIAFWTIYQYAPTLREIAAMLNLNSAEAVRYHLRALKREGRILWTEDVPRSVRIAEKTEAI